MSLTDVAIKNAKPREKRYRMHDEHGLYLEVAPAGGKWWRFKYKIHGKENRVSLGTYPDVSLKEARDKAYEARKLVQKGLDPSRQKKLPTDEAGRFRSVCREWWEKFILPKGGKHPDVVWGRMEREVLGDIGNIPIGDIDAPMVLTILRRIEARGTIETAHKVKSYISQTMRYGIACGLIHYDPARDLAGAITPRNKRPMSAIIDPKEVGGLMRSIYGYTGGPVVASALKLAALTFVRPGELRHAEWCEVDMDAAEWRIPAVKMKMKRPHLVPLSTQGIDVLSELRVYSGNSRYLFPSIRTNDRPMSDMTVNAALRALGYTQDRMTGHGFRAMANTLLAEMGWSMDAVERQLAHAEVNKVRAVYHRAEHLPERKRMMQAWADYLDELRLSV